MSEVIPNGFNEEDMLIIPTALDLSGAQKGLGKVKKLLKDAENSSEFDLVDPGAIEALREMQEQLEKLIKDMNNVKTNKISRTQFVQFQVDIEKRVMTIEARLNGLGDALVQVTEEFGKVGSDFDMSKVVTGFSEATEAIKGAVTAVSELNEISSNGSSIIIDDSGLERIEKALKGLKAAQKEYNIIDKNGETYLGEGIDETASLDKLETRFQMYASSYRNWTKTMKQAREEYQKAEQEVEENPGSVSSDDLSVLQMKKQKAELYVSYFATLLNRLTPIISKLQSESGITMIDFDTEKNQAYLRSTADIIEQLSSAGKDADAIISQMNAEISKFNDTATMGEHIPLFEESKKQATPLLTVLSAVENQYMQLETRAEEANKKIEETTKQVKAQSTLRDLLDNKAIDIEVKTDTKNLEAKLKKQVDDLQEELRKTSLFIPIKIYVESADIKEAGKSVEELNTEVSSTAIKNAQKEAYQTEKATKKAKEVILDLSKVTDKSAASVLKVMETALNKFVSDIKDKIQSVFSEKYSVQIELDEASKEEVKKSLSSDITLNEQDLAQNIENANISAKALADTLKEVLGLVEQSNAESSGLASFYTKGGKRKSENKIIEDLVGKLGEYRKAAQKIQEECQGIFNKYPIKLDLALKDGATDKVLKVIDESNFGYSLQQSLTHAESIAEGIVEVLKPLNGLEIRVSQTGKAAVNLGEMQKQVTSALAGVNILSKKIDQVYDSFKNIDKDDKGIKQVSIDFKEITTKIDELISSSKSLMEDLRLDLSVIDSSFKELEGILDKIFDNPEKQLHTITDEVNGLDLSKIEESLTNILNTLSSISGMFSLINSNLKETSDFKLGSKWTEVASAFKNLVKEGDNIDLRRQKKDVAEFLELYQEYLNLGGTNDLGMLTTNQKTLGKLQSQADSVIGGRSVVDNEKLKDTRQVLALIDDVLSSITSSLQTINGLENVSKVFNALNIKDKTLEKIQSLPAQLQQICEEIRKLDDMPPYSGFIKQLTQITAQAEGLKALADVLNKSSKEVNNVLENLNGNKQQKESLKEELKIANELSKRYEKIYNSGITEMAQPQEFANTMREVEELIRHIKSLNVEAADDTTVATAKQINLEIKNRLDLSERIKHSSAEMNGLLKDELKSLSSMGTAYKKALGNGDAEEKFGSEYVETLTKIDDRIKQLQSYEGLKVVTSEDIVAVKNLKAEIETLFQQLGLIAENVKQQTKSTAADFSTSLKEALRKSDSYERAYSRSWGFGKIEENYTNDYSARLKEIRNTLNEIQAIKSKGMSNLDASDLALIEKYNKDLEEQFKQLVQINQVAKETALTNLQDKMSQYILKNSRLTDGMVDELVRYIKELDNADEITKKRMNEIAASFNRVQYAAKVAGREGAGFLDAIRNKLKYGWAQSIAMFFGFYDIIRYTREISSAVTELNSNLIELSKVSDASIGELYNQFKDFADIAKETGGTINDVIEATSNWSRNGYNLADSKELARLSSIFQNIGDGMTADQSNEYLVSTLKGFNLQAKDAIKILDTLNNVANNSASSVADIGEALERSSSAFGASNTNLTESVALLVKANEVLQNPENVGTAFKSMSARLRAADTEIESLEDGFTMTTSKLRNLVQALTGFDIQETEDSYKSIYNILLGIGKEWENLTDLEQASLSEELFG